MARQQPARDGQPADARAALERYQLHGLRETGVELGRGSYAAVIEVDYKGMRCAAKKIYDILSAPGEGDRLVARFEEECRLLGKLRHPHIVQFLGIYFDDTTDLPVLVMEFLPATLAQCVDRYGRLPAENSYAILRDVALGLRYLHEQRRRVIHRDLSANNVLLTGDMAAKISDLGVAKILRINPAEMSRMTQTPGTQSYMPPEALRPNPRYDVEVDVFSFGVMLVHVLCGQWPFPSEATQVDPDNPARVIGLTELERRARYLDIIGRPTDEQEGDALMPLIERCLNNSPNLRPNASDLVERMSRASAEHPLAFSNRMDMMQRIASIHTEKEALQTQVSELEGQAERGQQAQTEEREENDRCRVALSLEVEQLRLQIADLEAEKTHLSVTASTREELLQLQLREREEALLIEGQAKDRSLQQCDQQHKAEKQQLQAQLQKKDQQLHAQLGEKDRLYSSQLSSREAQLQAKDAELSSQSSLLTRHRSTIESLHTQMQEAREHLARGVQVHAFSPNAKLVWRECAPMPKGMTLAEGTVINGMVYIGGGSEQQSIVKYDPVKNEWSTLPPAPVEIFGVGQLNGKLVIVGGVYPTEDETTGDIHVFEEETQQWVKSIPPMPSRIAFTAVACHGSCLVVCGGTSSDESQSASVSVYSSQSSQWHSAPPLPFSATQCSAVVLNDTCYVVAGCEGEIGTADKIIQSSSQSVVSAPLSTLLDPNASRQASTWQRMPDTPFYLSALVATGGCLLAVGGYNKPETAEELQQNITTAVHAYCPATSSWVKIGDMSDQRAWPTITTLPSGELFVAGGASISDEENDHKKVFIGIIN